MGIQRGYESPSRRYVLIVADLMATEKPSRPIEIVPEQVASHITAEHEVEQGALLDPWRRVISLAASTRVGRQKDEVQISIFHRTVSRNHALLAFDRQRKIWQLRDLNSANGTWVDGRHVVDDTIDLAGSASITFGSVPFLFAFDAREFAELERHRNFPRGTEEQSSPSESDCNESRFELHPLRHGGGVLVLGEVEIPLTLAQWELVSLLAKAGEKGFVPSPTIIEQIQWETAKPTYEHVKQLVRRVRALLKRKGAPCQIVSEYGKGYGLRTHRARC